MTTRLQYFTVAPDLVQKLVDLDAVVGASGLPPRLMHLIKLRASQINGCVYCLHLHAREARAAGEVQGRLDLLPAWREASCYTRAERAALAWTESLTEIANQGAPDEIYEELCRHFDESECVQLTLLIGVINIWNRMAIGFQSKHPKVSVPDAA
ncbi:MAG: carboxymuconolactone decarboxylase family protein [Roseovarius sp.]|uniref:carboxymuconolactone decarboxylase family protein n=1 Tax=Roseovarius sp. TaxID=1486281 RepID=UPI001B4DCC19|nr:carboxymuconolactone decarboxylase family protein [Roseovarius sp.]MBQ0751440.1 carboxymuconolactone decarboxylase family protein [Roseovarius sp.]MBQ0809545.1 carboxymuconolactone decarboxylase family protein [Roseovarius sp.]